MAYRNRRDALRGSEVQMLDLIFEVLTSQQWAELLKAPLERAVAKGDRDLAQKLLGARAEVGDALHEAVRGGDVGIVSDLLESGASISKKDRRGENSLHVAARQGKTEVVQMMLLKRADKDAFDRFDNHEDTPLSLAAYQGHLATVLALLAAGVEVNLRCGVSKTPVMHLAAEIGHVEMLRALIEHGADVAGIDSNRRTALHIAAFTNNTEVVDALVEAGANIEARNRHGYTPLYLASNELTRETLLRLLKHGANVNAQDNHLQTPLMCAALSAGKPGAAEVVDDLLRADADETIVDDDGEKASDMIGVDVEEDGRLADVVERVRELLANAPADKAWRRRGYLVLCRAHPDRVQQNQVISDTARTTRSRAKLAKAGASGFHEAVGGGNIHEPKGGGWAVVAAKVLRLQEEGIFRTILGYL